MNTHITHISPLFLKQLADKLSPRQILTDPADCFAYSYDNSRYQAMPDVVVLAESAEDIQHVVRCCHAFCVPVVARGRGTGTPGGAVPVAGGVVLSLEKFNKIIAIDADNRLIHVQAGVLNQAVQDAVAPYGFFWAPDPGSAAYCTVGGNAGYNAAGPRAVKYGATREHVLGLKAVIGTGDIITVGTHTTKGAVGYDLTRLLIGSEGTLGIITELALKLTPLPLAVQTMQIVYQNFESAAQAVAKIMAQPFTPAALEFLDKNALKLVSHTIENIPENAGALLLIDLDGSPNDIQLAQEKIFAAANNAGLLLFKTAENALEAKKLWAARKALSPALRSVAPKKINEDVVVPVANLPVLLEQLENMSARYSVPIISFGHAGNGNVHVNLLTDPENNPEHTPEKLHACLAEIFALVIKLHGTLSGEHGIGLDKKAFLPEAVDPIALDLMRKIKQQFDPKNILNPGKIFE